MHEAIPESFEEFVKNAKNGEKHVDPSTLLAMADCFLLKTVHSPSDIALFDEFAHHTLHACSAVHMCALAEKLGPHPQTPLWIFDVMKAAGGSVSPALIRSYLKMPYADLLAFARTGSEAEAVAVAQRPDLSLEIISYLLERGERAIFYALAKNLQAPLERRHFLRFVRDARTDKEMAAALFERPHEGEDSAPLFLSASPQERTRIILAVRRAMLGKPNVNVLAPRQELFIRRLEELAIAKDWQGFAEQLATWLGCTMADAVAIVEDPFGEPLAVALAACGAKADSAGLVFLSRPDDISQSVELVHGLTHLVASLSQKEAERLMTSMLDLTSARAKRSGHSPVYDDKAATTPSRPVVRVMRERHETIQFDADTTNKNKG